MNTQKLTSISIMWNRLNPLYSNGAVTGYKIYYFPFTTKAMTVLQTSASTFSATLDDLEKDTFYLILVMGQTSKGEGVQSRILTRTRK